MYGHVILPAVIVSFHKLGISQVCKLNQQITRVRVSARSLGLG